MKKLMFLTLATAALLCSCHTSKNTESKQADAVTAATQAAEIPYAVANRYFVRNDVKKLPNGKIASQKDFDTNFGMAAVMGEDGMPTEIDFTKQYVIAVSKPETNKDTEIVPVSLKSDGDGGLVFTYRLKEGATCSYTTLPSLVVVVDKKYKGHVSLSEIED